MKADLSLLLQPVYRLNNKNRQLCIERNALCPTVDQQAMLGVRLSRDSLWWPLSPGLATK